MNVRQQLGTNIRRLRAERLLSQEALAHKAAVNRTYLSDLEVGRRNPTIDVVSRIAEALGVSPGSLLD